MYNCSFYDNISHYRTRIVFLIKFGTMKFPMTIVTWTHSYLIQCCTIREIVVMFSIEEVTFKCLLLNKRPLKVYLNKEVRWDYIHCVHSTVHVCTYKLFSMSQSTLTWDYFHLVHCTVHVCIYKILPMSRSTLIC